MQVQIALFGGARVVTGKAVVALVFKEPTVTLAQALEELIAAYPRAQPYLLDASGTVHPSLRVLINHERPVPDATLTTLLHDGDRITLLIAVAGGALPGCLESFP